ncbi:MAG: IS1634 family transposase [Bryobacterales bacterium]|nr:IS1634 family transposase [Bryobacterales bacterium]
MHITSSFARKSPCHLLRESYWHNGKVKKRTLANLSALPQPLIDLLKAALDRQLPLGSPDSPAQLGRVRQHGAVSALLGLARSLRFDRLLFHKPSRQRSLALALILARLLKPGAKLRLERELGPTGQTTLAPLLDIADTPVDDLYDAMDWLLQRQPAIERKLAQRHLSEGGLALYDLSSSYFEGSRCALARRGYSRDHRSDRPQITYGLLCNADGCPVAVEVFPGNSADPATLSAQVNKLRQRFGLQRLAVVGDRGMLAQTRIAADLGAADLDWITALRHDSIRKLAEQGCFQPSLFDTHGLAAITSEDYPDERLLVCYNPLVAAERRRKREDLLTSTEADLALMANAYAAGKIDRDELNRRLGTLRRRKMGKHLQWSFDERSEAFSSTRNEASIAAEGRLDGFYVVRTSLAEQDLDDAGVVRAYKSLARVERAFRSLKTSGLRVRPIFHWKAERVRAHLLLCMLAYYLEWHLRHQLAPLLFSEEGEPQHAGGPVGPLQRSAAAQRKDCTRQTEDGSLPLQSLADLLAGLGTLSAAELKYEQVPGYAVPALSQLEPLHERVFELLGFQPHPAPPLGPPPNSGGAESAKTST